MGGCQNYGPHLGPYIFYLRYPKRGHNFDNYPHGFVVSQFGAHRRYDDMWLLGLRLPAHLADLQRLGVDTSDQSLAVDRYPRVF